MDRAFFIFSQKITYFMAFEKLIEKLEKITKNY